MRARRVSRKSYTLVLNRVGADLLIITSIFAHTVLPGNMERRWVDGEYPPKYHPIPNFQGVLPDLPRDRRNVHHDDILQISLGA